MILLHFKVLLLGLREGFFKLMRVLFQFCLGLLDFEFLLWDTDRLFREERAKRGRAHKGLFVCLVLRGTTISLEILQRRGLEFRAIPAFSIPYNGLSFIVLLILSLLLHVLLFLFIKVVFILALTFIIIRVDV
jgi:hypothetical protein